MLYGIRIEMPEGEVKSILDELTKAQETIHKCYRRLEELGVVTVVFLIMRRGVVKLRLRERRAFVER